MLTEEDKLEKNTSLSSLPWTWYPST